MAVRPVRRVRFHAAAGLALLAVVASMFVSSAAMAGTVTHRAGSPPTSTARVHLSPVTATGQLKRSYHVVKTAHHATCLDGSEAGAGVWRCFAGNFVFDPCWRLSAAHFTVVCLSAPWRRNVAKLVVAHANGSPKPGKEPVWGIRLGNFRRCLLIQGTHRIFHGHVVTYGCRGRLVLVGRADRSHKVWRIRTAHCGPKACRLGRMAPIRTAWFVKA